MAKPSKNEQEQEGEISVSMFKISIKGSDTSLQKGLDTIKAALVQAGFAAPEQKYIRSNGTKPAMLLPAEEVEIGGEDNDDDTTTLEEVTYASPPTTPKKPAAPRRPPSYKIISDLKFDDVSPTLAAFIEEKQPKTDLDKYLCTAYWFKHYKNTDDLMVEHFFSAYMTYRWKLPTNPGSPVADLRHARRQLLIAGKTAGTWTISNPGERKVNEMGKND